MPPLVSIIIPAYNSEKYLAETVRSALAQTWANKELIIVDDGSADNTLTIAKQFESKIVKVLSQANRGAASARNAGLAVAQGELIQWLDADDLLAPNKISLQLSAADSQDSTVLLSSAYSEFYRVPRRRRRIQNSLMHDMSARDWLVTSLSTGNWLPPIVWLVSRKLTEQAGPWDERLSLNDDGEYFSRIVSRSSYIKYVEESLCFYRQGIAGSLSRHRSDKALASLSLSLNLTINHLLKLEDSMQTRSAAVAFLQYCVDAFAIKESAVWDGFASRAQNLGGKLRFPSETWQFRTARALFGDRAASRMKNAVVQSKWKLLQEFERVVSN